MRRVLCGLVGLLLSSSLQAATVDGLKIHSTTTGAGPQTVILVHGYTCDESTWTEQVPALATRYRVITLDLPGHGRSDVPPVDKFSMDLFARAIEAVRAEAKAERVVLVGHSMGTPVVLRYAHSYPQHTAALVFVDGLMPAPPNPAVPTRGVAMGGPGGRRNREAMVRRFFSVSTTPPLQKKILDMMLGAPEATAIGAMDATFEAAGQTTDVPAVPMLGIYAGPNGLASRSTVQGQFPSAEYVQIDGTGHFLMLEKPQAFNRLLLDFLAKQQ